MAFLRWLAQFETGIPEVDREHRELISLLNQLHDGIENDDHAGVAAFLVNLQATIAVHFRVEERLMRKAGFALYAAHKADHERLLDEIRLIAEAHRDGLYANAPAALAQHLDAWFSRHFQTMDVRLHKALNGER